MKDNFARGGFHRIMDKTQVEQRFLIPGMEGH